MRRAWVAGAVAVLAAATAIAESGSSRRTVVRRLAYVTGGAGSVPQVWLADPQGRHAHRLGPGQDPLLAPDGSRVAASLTARQGHALALYSTTGRDTHVFFDARRMTAAAQAWSADARYLAVALRSRDPADGAGSGLAILDTTTFTYRLVARGPVYGACFPPDGTNRVVYAVAARLGMSARIDIDTVSSDGGQRVHVTHDGASLNPVCDGGDVVFDHERRRANAEPVLQVCRMRLDGSHRVQLTRLRVPPMKQGLAPVSASPDGTWILANYVGLDTREAWALTVGTGRPRAFPIGGSGATAAAVSRNGALALIDRGGFLNAPSRGVVEMGLLAGGGRWRLVSHGSEPTWNL